MDVIEVTIVNWSTHNPRSTIKHPRWFALSNRILEDPDFFDFSDAEFKAWIYILCQASQKNESVIAINLHHAARVCNIKSGVINSCLAKLQKAKCIQLRDHGVNTCVPIMITTEQNKTEQNKTNTIAQSFDFASVYDFFPRKVGKEKGMAFLKRSVKTPEDFSLLTHAVKKYREHVANENTEPRYIKHFSTWVSSWRDWVAEDVGTSTVKSANAMPDLSHIKWDDE